MFPPSPISRWTYEAVAGSKRSRQTAQCIKRSTCWGSIPVFKRFIPAFADACEGRKLLGQSLLSLIPVINSSLPEESLRREYKGDSFSSISVEVKISDGKEYAIPSIATREKFIILPASMSQRFPGRNNSSPSLHR